MSPIAQLIKRTGVILATTRIAAIAPIAVIAACAEPEVLVVSDKLADYATVRLTADLSGLTERQRAMVRITSYNVCYTKL